MGVVLI